MAACACLVTAAIASLAVITAGASGHRIAAQRRPAVVPDGEDGFGSGPWAFARHGPEMTPLAAAHNQHYGEFGESRLTGDVHIHLDDGTTGTLRAEQRGCDTCEPPDCGPFKTDSFWIHVLGPNGHEVARVHFCAAYGLFDVIPVDLVDGPGDELMIVSVMAHASPPPFACARWRGRVSVDLQRDKPRAIVVQRMLVRLPPGCRPDELARVEIGRWRQEVLRVSSGRYVTK